MSPERTIGIGILGLHEGRTLLVGLQGRARHARAVAGCDLRQEKIDAARREVPGAFYTTAYEEMLARPEVDVVAIYTPDPFHGEHIVRAFESGKDVICTKPIVNNVADARTVLESARRTGRKLMVGQSTRFFESFIRQRQAYERGEVGELEMVDAHYVHRMDWYYDKSPWAARDSDWVFLGMSHPLDLCRWYLGAIAEVQAYAGNTSVARRYGVVGPDLYVANLRSHDGRIGRAMGNYGLHELPSARNAIELVLYGSAGTSLAQYHDMCYHHSAADGAEIREDMLYSRRAYYFNDEVHGVHYGEFANYADYFAQALLEGRPWSPDLNEGLETFCLMEAVRLSAQTGCPIPVAPLLEEIGLGPTEVGHQGQESP